MRAPRVLLAGALLAQAPGGVRRHHEELLPRVARLLAERGGSLTVLVGRDGAAFELPPPLTRLESAVPSHPIVARALLEGRALRQALAQAAERGEGYDGVHTAHLPAPRGLPVPFTLTLHDLRALEFEHTPFSRRLVAERVIGGAVARAAAVITVSQTVAQTLARHFRPRRLFQVPNAADHLRVEARRPGPGAPLLHVGHVERRKNLELLLRALAFDAGLPPLLLAGAAKADEDERLRACARALGVEARVRFLGAFPEAALAELYASAAAVVIPSRLEGFGIGVLEAQRARVPLAIATTGALPEVAGPEVPSFAPDDPAACARAVRAALAASPAELEAAAKRSERYSWDASAARFAAALEEAFRVREP